MTLGRLALVITIVAVAVLAVLFFRAPAGPRSLRTFEPNRLADLEVDMWQAYYRKENVRLFRDLLVTLHEQYNYSWAQATVTGFYLARAASSFATMTGDYDRAIPDLERAFARIRTWTNATFDPAAVARAELTWWVARRIPGQDSAEQVGRLIADENALIFDVPAARLLAPSVLRAQAGKLRDDGGLNRRLGHRVKALARVVSGAARSRELKRRVDLNWRLMTDD
jgi:hypothetical protein